MTAVSDVVKVCRPCVGMGYGISSVTFSIRSKWKIVKTNIYACSKLSCPLLRIPLQCTILCEVLSELTGAYSLVCDEN